MPGVINTDTKTLQAWLPHSYVKLHVYEQNGETYYQVYASTQSQYAPNGDSGTFTFDASGNLISNNAAALNRIRNEAQEADPGALSDGIWGWFKSHWHQITGCGLVAGGGFLAVASFFVPPVWGAVAAGGAFLGGVSGVFGHAATECF